MNLDMKMNIHLIRNKDRYDIEIPVFMEILQKVKTIKNHKRDSKTRIYSIPKIEKQKLIELLSPIAQIEIKETRDVETIDLEIDIDDDRIYAKVANYFKVSKILEPLLQLFRGIEDKKYLSDEHKWSFPIETAEEIKNGVFDLIKSKKFKLKCEFFDIQ